MLLFLVVVAENIFIFRKRGFKTDTGIKIVKKTINKSRAHERVVNPISTTSVHAP